MSTDTMKRSTSTSREVQASPSALEQQTSQRLPVEAIGVAVAVLATLVV